MSCILHPSLTLLCISYWRVIAYASLLRGISWPFEILFGSVGYIFEGDLCICVCYLCVVDLCGMSGYFWLVFHFLSLEGSSIQNENIVHFNCWGEETLFHVFFFLFLKKKRFVCDF